MKPVFRLCDRATSLIAGADPILSTYAGVEGNDHRWTDTSPNGIAERAAQFKDLMEQASGLSPVDPHESLAKEVLVDELRRWLDAFEHQDHLRDLNSIESTHQHIRQVFDMMRTDTVEDWHCIVSRLESIGDPVDGYRQCLSAGLANQTVVATRQVEAVIEQGRTAANSSSEFAKLLETYDQQSIDDDAMRRRLVEGIANAQTVFADFTDWLESSYLPHSHRADGVGRDQYVRAAATHLGTEIDPEATYAWGWTELKRLWGELDKMASQVSSGGIADAIHLLETDPERAATSEAEFVELMHQRQRQALEQLAGTYFDVPEAIREIDIKIESPTGALAPHYTPPSEDFSRRGAVSYPVAGTSYFPLYTEITTAYHEGFPGHHLQLGLQMNQADQLSRFHRLLVWYPGSGEGWALYAEHLMDELGYLETPDYRIGLLVSKIMRTCRIVIDIGIHLGLPIPDDADFHPGEHWTFDLAKEMMMTRALQPEAMSTSEVIRYCGWPGQAISYKVGEQALLDLRSEAQAKPGFDSRLWHADVLGLGSIGLDLLRRQIRSRW